MDGRRERWRARAAYHLDTIVAKRPWVVLAWLGLLTLAVVVIAAVVITLTQLAGVDGNEGPVDFWDAFWLQLFRILDPGTMSSDTGWPARIIGLGVTLTGIFLAGGLIGVIATVLGEKLDDLRKGRSVVLEQDHTLILGWSSRVPTIVDELREANASRSSPVIVIVADEEKTVMEDALRTPPGTKDATKIVCRSGSPWTDEALEMGNLGRARSVIVTTTGDDAETVKVLLALHLKTRSDRRAPVVAEVTDPGLGASLETIMGTHLVTVSSDDVVAELTAQACRQQGIGDVFAELLSFAGSEIYSAAFPSLEGKTFGEACLAFPGSAVIGFELEGHPVVNPPADTVLPADCNLLAVSEDDSTFTPGEVSADTLPVTSTVSSADVSHVVVVGWSSLGPRVLRELDEYLGEGSSIEIVVDPRLVAVDEVEQSFTGSMPLAVTPLAAGPEAVARHVWSRRCDQLIVLGYRDAMSVDQADARTLLTVLALNRREEGRVRMVTEILDPRHAGLATAAGADDFVVSEQLTSQMLSQLSENPYLRDIFAGLFSATGNAVHVVPLTDLAPSGMEVTFGDVVATLLQQDITAIGWIPDGDQLRLSPAKSDRVEVSAGTRAVVLRAGGTGG